MGTEWQRTYLHGSGRMMEANTSISSADSTPLLRRIDASGIPLLVTRLFLGGLFVWMGCSKIAEPFDFLKLIRQYEMLPESPGIFLNSVAITLPWIEVFAGGALILGLFLRGGAASILIMLLVFTPAIFLRAMAIHNAAGTPFFDIKFDCGCGSGDVIIWKKLLSNTGLVLLALYALLSPSRKMCLEGRVGRRKCQSSLDLAGSPCCEEVDPAQ